MPVTFFTGNYLEHLAQRLSEDIKSGCLSPFDRPVVIVQSNGMMKWLSLQLARHNGICANIAFRFPKDFIYECFHSIAGILPSESLYEKDSLTWKIMDMLPQFIESKEFSSLKNYLKQRESSLKYYQLAEKIASLYDQYLIFRPQWIFDWQSGKSNNWQAILWRALVSELGTGHPAQIREQFKNEFEKISDIKDILPNNIYIFGISSLPKFHVEVFNLISEKTNVRLYHLNPCKEYWGKADRRTESGLIASMGKLGRDFFEILLNNNIYSNEDNEFFTDIEKKNILTAIQSDILELNDPLLLEKSFCVEEKDTSVAIHSCHSPMREIEVLYDNLLEIFNSDSTLKPEDIVVMAPDIEVYAPYIHAVFGTASQRLKIPYSIADRSIRRESRIVDTFLKILEMHSTRFTAVEVLEVLEVPAVLNKFSITDIELESLLHWIRDTQIRWGKDSSDKKELGLPEYEENTWEAGFKRLFLGYAMPGENEQMYNDILPYDNIEGMDAVSLGKLYQFMRTLYSVNETLKRNFTLSSWADELLKITDEFFSASTEEQSQLNKLIRVISELEAYELSLGFNNEVDILLISHYLKCRLELESSGQGFLKGGLTFCSLLPVRSIPFRVVCLTGMNHDSFPRESKTLGFDLMRRYPDIGDRSKRIDDRYLFLECIISAREKLYISYVGQSIKDNSPIPPSVLVSEIIDYAQNFFIFPGDVQASDFLTTKHKLQAFNPEYFSAESNRLFSYSDNYCRTAECYVKPRIKKQPLAMTGLSLPVPEINELDINDLIKFFESPAKYFLRQRLGIHLIESDDTFETSESFKLENYDVTIIGGEITEKLVSEHRRAAKGEIKFDIEGFLEKHYQIVKASGKLPHGNSGRVYFNELSSKVSQFAEHVFNLTGGNEPSSKAIEVNINGIKLHGYIQSVYGNELLSFRYAKVKSKDRLKFWINFLALNASEEAPFKAKMALKDDKKIYVVFQADIGSIINEHESHSLAGFCKETLGELLEIYKKGQTSPIKFFPGTSWAYFEEKHIRGKELSKAIEKARKEWSGDFTEFKERDEMDNNLCFGDSDIFDDEFERISLAMFTKLNKYIKEV